MYFYYIYKLLMKHIYAKNIVHIAYLIIVYTVSIKLSDLIFVEHILTCFVIAFSQHYQ